MRNTLLFITLTMLLLSACNACNHDKNTGSGNNSDSTGQQSVQIPDNFENQEYTLPFELEYCKTGKDFLYNKFYPIGWSKDGKFAYIVEPADEASGYYWFEIVILDIVNNKISWSWKPDKSEQGNIQSIWKDNYDLFKKNLSEAEIIQIPKFELKPTKSSYKGNDYDLVMETKTVTDPDFGVEMVKEYEIRLVSEELGSKSVSDSKEAEMVVGVIIPGFLMCPFDDRIVVLCKKERFGYEGPPNVVYFELLGSDLIRGFKKDKDS